MSICVVVVYCNVYWCCDGLLCLLVVWWFAVISFCGVRVCCNVYQYCGGLL